MIISVRFDGKIDMMLNLTTMMIIDIIDTITVKLIS